MGMSARERWELVLHIHSLRAVFMLCSRRLSGGGECLDLTLTRPQCTLSYEDQVKRIAASLHGRGRQTRRCHVFRHSVWSSVLLCPLGVSPKKGGNIHKNANSQLLPRSSAWVRTPTI